MTNKFHHAGFLAFSIFVCSLLYAVPSLAANLTLTATIAPESMALALEIDKVDKLAGIKISIDYPAQFLSVRTVQKAAAFDSFMQVVNDKEPGRVILVMASASGVSGDNLKILDIKFLKKTEKLPSSLKIKPTECQLMSESLQNISCNFSQASDSSAQPRL